MALARREARESRYWLRLTIKVGLTNKAELINEARSLADEANEIMLILSSIVNKVRNGQKAV